MTDKLPSEWYECLAKDGRVVGYGRMIQKGGKRRVFVANLAACEHAAWQSSGFKKRPLGNKKLDPRFTRGMVQSRKSRGQQ